MRSTEGQWDWGNVIRRLGVSKSSLAGSLDQLVPRGFQGGCCDRDPQDQYYVSYVRTLASYSEATMLRPFACPCLDNQQGPSSPATRETPLPKPGSPLKATPELKPNPSSQLGQFLCI